MKIILKNILDDLNLSSDKICKQKFSSKKCINENLEYRERGSSTFYFDEKYKNESEFFKNIYIDEFEHKNLKSVDLLTLVNFKDEKNGRFYFIEVKSNLNCYKYEEIKNKLIDSIKKLDEVNFSHTNFKLTYYVIGNERQECEYNSKTTLKLKNEIADIEFLDIPIGEIKIIKSDGIIDK